MTDWQRWHEEYDDPASAQSERLRAVQAVIRDWAGAVADRGDLERPVVVSLCAGRADDVAGALAGHPLRSAVRVVAVELDPELAAAARLLLEGIDAEVVAADAGAREVVEALPAADLLLLCGIFGNVSDDDVRRTVTHAPAMCRPGATVVWTRHRRAPDLTPQIRQWSTQAGVVETAFVSPGEDSWSVWAGTAAAPPERSLSERLFTFR